MNLIYSISKIKTEGEKIGIPVRFSPTENGFIPFKHIFVMRKKDALNKNIFNRLVSKNISDIRDLLRRYGYLLVDNTKLYICNMKVEIKEH